MSKAPQDASLSSEHDERRREFLELCGRVGVGVPPAVMLLASSGNALASHGRAGHGGNRDYGNDDHRNRRDWTDDGPGEGRHGGGRGRNDAAVGGSRGGSGGVGRQFGGGAELGRGWWFPRFLERVFGYLFGW